jgi:hypothetical protein
MTGKIGIKHLARAETILGCDLRRSWFFAKWKNRQTVRINRMLTGRTRGQRMEVKEKKNGRGQRRHGQTAASA